MRQREMGEKAEASKLFASLKGILRHTSNSLSAISVETTQSAPCTVEREVADDLIGAMDSHEATHIEIIEEDSMGGQILAAWD